MLVSNLLVHLQCECVSLSNLPTNPPPSAGPHVSECTDSNDSWQMGNRMRMVFLSWGEGVNFCRFWELSNRFKPTDV
jgi:hypothetical protein